MTELDQVWAHLLDDAARRAVDRGHDDIAAYLRLKATNDAIRMAGVKWLFDTAVEMAVDRQITHPRMTIERVDPHRFALGNSRMVGSKLDIRYGVRCLTIEAGWTRSPSDGVMRGRALAHARVLHFGLPRHDENLKLVRGDALPQWLSESGNAIESSDLREHFDRLLDL